MNLTVDIPSLVRRLGELYQKHGKDLYLVGGVVRDEVLGRPTNDLDFATSAVPDETRKILQEARPDSIYDVGEKFGTIGAVWNGVAVEITSYRTEQYTLQSRKPEVRFGTSLAEDLARRDFTINAMARNALTGELVDLYGGMNDLRDGVIRAVGRPDERFAEDPLRLLRAVRFAAQLGFSIEPKTAEAMRRSAPLLSSISRERILEEMNRILTSPNPSWGLRMLADWGLLNTFLPEVPDLRRTTQGKRSKDVFEHTLGVVERTRPDLVLRWAALLHDIGKPRTITQEGGEIHFPAHEVVGEQISREIMNRLRADRALGERVSKLAGMHMRANQYEDEWTNGAVRRLMRDAGPDLERLLELSTADVTSYRPAKIEAALRRVRRLRERIQRLEEETSLAAIKSPLDGNDLMAMFHQPPGRWVGEVKDYLLEQVLEGKLRPEDKATAEVMARQFMKERLVA